MVQVIAILLALASAATAGDLMIRADSGRPMRYGGPEMHYYTGRCWTPGSDGDGTMPYWSTPSNSGMPSIQFWTEQRCDALTLAFSARTVSPFAGLDMVNLLACPDVDVAITNIGGPATNRFLVLDANNSGGSTGGIALNTNSWSFLDGNWHHYAACYEPRVKGWTYWKDGKRLGTATASDAVWTNGWNYDSVMILNGISFLAWRDSRMDMDRFAAWHRKLTDAEVHADYLSWRVRRFGVTADAPYTLALSALDLPVAIPDTVTAVTTNDAILRKEVTAVTKHDKQIVVSVSRGFPTWGMTAGPTNIATLDGSGRLTHVSDGAATVTLSATNNGGGFTSTHTLGVTLATDGVTTWSYTGAVPGSVRAATLDWITPALAAGGEIGRFSTIDHAATNYVRNAACWATNVDLGCIPVWNSATDNSEFSPTLISPESGLACNHAYPGIGSRVRWVTAAGEIVERSILASQQVWNDLRAFRLSEPITNITPAGLFASTNLFAVHTNGLSGGAQCRGYRIPVVSSDQFMRASVRDIYHMGAMTAFIQPVDAARLAYFTAAISGDSGSPSFMIVSNKPILIAVYTTGGAGTGPGIPTLYDAVTNICRQLGDTNVISAYDTSGFITYP